MTKKRKLSTSSTTPPSPLKIPKSTTPSSFHLQHAKFQILLPPIYSETPLLGATDYLDSLLLSYHHPLNGVILAYQNVEFEDKVAKILYDSPYARTNILAEILVWRPTKEGDVNLQSPDHIGLLLHGTFNASISRDKIPESWKFHGTAWKNAHGETINGLLKFKVQGWKTTGSIISVSGSLKPE
ncbi:DNA-directed RNA polymerase I subunit rpa43 [Neolecta irregularis DAH-3]|uniref:DNA-directed RNA polymerase subunit n=1 Tax=Neolecta irregularis (strain DAH-3) TaxID=1198029 RepID=A0A1U7LL78_NEOID|nr:DNA-directed RNA polymerase I subunit rpa43 [Neolecta irregularis DAH-3]|eukprot:OLL23410.1 DNA-directed RNA polymerase I subunit rpa43 [Neolecta irregularis DAH-3]